MAQPPELHSDFLFGLALPVEDDELPEPAARPVGASAHAVATCPNVAQLVLGVGAQVGKDEDGAAVRARFRHRGPRVV